MNLKYNLLSNTKSFFVFAHAEGATDVWGEKTPREMCQENMQRRREKLRSELEKEPLSCEELDPYRKELDRVIRAYLQFPKEKPFHMDPFNHEIDGEKFTVFFGGQHAEDICDAHFDLTDKTTGKTIYLEFSGFELKREKDSDGNDKRLVPTGKSALDASLGAGYSSAAGREIGGQRLRAVLRTIAEVMERELKKPSFYQVLDHPDIVKNGGLNVRSSSSFEPRTLTDIKLPVGSKVRVLRTVTNGKNEWAKVIIPENLRTAQFKEYWNIENTIALWIVTKRGKESYAKKAK